MRVQAYRATMALLLCLASWLAAAPQAVAATQSCTTSIKGKPVKLKYNNDETLLYENMTFREIFFARWGEIDCPAYITLRHLTPKLKDKQRGAFCLQYDKGRKTYTGFNQGARDAYWVCKQPSKSFCQRVEASKDAALAMAGLRAGASAGAMAAAHAAGVSVVSHSSGAVILTGSSGYIAGTLGTLGASVLGVLTAPATLAAATVSLVAVGGAVYVCR